MAGQEAVRFWGRKWAESDCTKKTGKKSKKGSGNGVGSGTGLGSGFESESVSLSGLEAGQESDLGMALSPVWRTANSLPAVYLRGPRGYVIAGI
jgi:hypothetical protein